MEFFPCMGEKMKEKKLLLSFDLEEYEKGGAQGMEIGYKGGIIVQQLLEKIKVKATFFVTGTFYQAYPDFVKELSQKHEIAFHGLDHADDYQGMAEDKACHRLVTGKTDLEKGLSSPVEGFRAPRMRPPAYTVLKKVPFLYSSSLHPTYVPGRYNHLRKPQTPFIKEGVLEIPVSVAPVVRLPVSWVWFRTGGLTYAKVVTSFITTPYIAIYFHPWEFVPLKGSIYTKNTGKPMEKALEKFLTWISAKADSMTMAAYAHQFLQGL